MACPVCRIAVDGFQHTLDEALGDQAGQRGEKWIEVVHGGKRYAVRISFVIHATCQELAPNQQVQCEQRIVVTG